MGSVSRNSYVTAIRSPVEALPIFIDRRRHPAPVVVLPHVRQLHVGWEETPPEHVAPGERPAQEAHPHRGAFVGPGGDREQGFAPAIRAAGVVAVAREAPGGLGGMKDAVGIRAKGRLESAGPS